MKLNKSTVILTLSLLVGIIFFLLYQKYQELNKQTTDAIQSIPINAALIVESENWSSTLNELENTMLWKTISNSEIGQKSKKQLKVYPLNFKLTIN